MEPVTHFLTGACLGRTGFNRRTAYATLAMTLAAVTQNASVASAPQGSQARVKHVDLVSLEPNEVLLILLLEGNLLRQQVPHFEPLVEAFGYRNFRMLGKEADDVIGTLSAKAVALDGRPTLRPRRSASSSTCVTASSARMRRTAWTSRTRLRS